MSLASSPTSFFIATTDGARAKKFYEDILGLTCTEDSDFAVVFALANAELRISKVQSFTPFPWTVLDWQVGDISNVMQGLERHGVNFLQFEEMEQDERGIWTVPGTSIRIAWFKDPDGNVLSISQR